MFYGIAANWTKRFLTGVDALTNATGSMVAASLVLLPAAVLTWPQAPVSAMAWGATVLLAVVCTGAAYIVFFRLIANVGPPRGQRHLPGADLRRDVGHGS